MSLKSWLQVRTGWPSAERTANSLARVAVRVKISIPTFAHATTSTINARMLSMYICFAPRIPLFGMPK